MNCSETQPSLSLYLDGQMEAGAQAACETHLRRCPVCRAELADLRFLTRDLSLLARPVAPPDLAANINFTLAAEAAVKRQTPPLSWSEQIANWLRPRLLPYTVGSFASVMLFFSAFGALSSSLRALNDWDYTERLAVAREYQRIYGVDFPGYDIQQPVTPQGLALLRQPVTDQSPTLNPQGALLSVIRSLSFDDDTDEMMVVADIFSDGSAALTDVMTPPRDPRLLRDVQRALRQNPAFVPATYDGRPQTLRVVFVVQNLGVRDTEMQFNLAQ